MKINGKSLLISTHMMHVAYQLADEIFILVNGVIKSVTNDFTSFEAFENYVITELNVNI
jgi:ABC-type multidrug transport system ATPase subunit